MCIENTKMDTRKHVLELIHKAASEKNKNGYVSNLTDCHIRSATDKWINELADKHKIYTCKICGHRVEQGGFLNG